MPQGTASLRLAAGAWCVHVGSEAGLACRAAGAIPSKPHAARPAAPTVTIPLTFMLSPSIAGDRPRRWL